MTIKPILKYPGAKWNLAAWIISHFPAHAHYVEPYFGSGAVFFNKQPAKHEVINDLSGDVVNLFRVIREDGERLAALIEMTPYSRAEYDLSSEPATEPAERARRFLVHIGQSHSADGLRGKGSWSFGPKLSSRGDVSSRAGLWRGIADRIMPISDRMRFVDVENCPALDLVTRYQQYSTALIYADPPYPLSTRNGKMYQHGMTDSDHSALLDALDAHPGPVVLSGYHCALYDDRLKRWHTREKQAQAEKGNTRTEVLWLNQTCIDRLGYGPMFERGVA